MRWRATTTAPEQVLYLDGLSDTIASLEQVLYLDGLSDTIASLEQVLYLAPVAAALGPEQWESLQEGGDLH